MRDLDIDACLAQNPDEEPFIVELRDADLFPDGSPSLTMQVRYAEFRKIFAKYYKASIKPGNKRDGTETAMELGGDDYEFGLRMLDYVIGWDGISGTFDQGKLKKFFLRFPTVCEAFGKAISGVFKVKDAHYLKYREDVEKN